MSPEGTATSAQSPQLRIPAAVLSAILAQAENELPNECCGVLGGVDGVVMRQYPLPNVLASPVAFESEPRAMFAAMRDMRANGWDVLAVYHSHPSSPAVPSRTDLAQCYAETVVNLIVSGQEIRAWRYSVHGAIEVSFAVEVQCFLRGFRR